MSEPANPATPSNQEAHPQATARSTLVQKRQQASTYKSTELSSFQLPTGPAELAASKNVAPEEEEQSATPTGSQQSSNQSVATSNTSRPYPKQVFYIVANEFCERFSYYGLRTVLVLYFKHALGYQDTTSAISFHLFAALCYLTPLLGAILGDSVWGRYKTILRLSCVYFVGELILVISSVLWNSGQLSQALMITGLLLIGLGTGGIKPCVCALGGDQFLPNEVERRQTFFSIFYASINLGSLISMFLTPVLRSQVQCVGRADCYPLAFGVPCALMLVSIVVFLGARNQYHLVPLPDRNVTLAFCKCVALALKRKFKGQKQMTDEETRRLRDSRSTMATNTSVSSLGPATGVSDDESQEEALVRELKMTLHNQMGKKVGSSSALPDQVSQQGHWAKRGSSVDPLTPVVALQTLSSNMSLEQPADRNHWLYLASDQFDSKSIEDFRAFLRNLVLFLPLPMYWCLYDQQSSLWTLQATRMNGRFFNTGLYIQPDQISVANPLLLLLCIPLFEVFIYPNLKRCNLLTRSVDRITAGGLLAALTFVVLSVIELQLQANQPPTSPEPGNINLLLVNGLSTCSLNEATFSKLPYQYDTTLAANNQSTPSFITHLNTTNPSTISHLEPFKTNSLEVASEENSLNSYQLNFRLKSNANITAPLEKCPLNSDQNYHMELRIAPDSSAKILYLEQANGQLNFRIFNNSLSLPQPGMAQVRFIFEFFGSSSQASKLNFTLVPASLYGSHRQLANSSSASVGQHLPIESREGQVMVSQFRDVATPAHANPYKLAATITGGTNTVDSQLIDQISNFTFVLQPGTRNLIIIHQRDSNSVEMRHELLQDNSYQLSILWQLIPYLMISMSEVLFSITVSEFSYSIAPETMKSLSLGCMSLTVAVGNIFTVAIESMHLFSNLAHDFLFYASIMLIDIILFALLALSFKPPRTTTTTTSTK